MELATCRNGSEVDRLMVPVSYLDAQLRIDQLHREADQARLARRHRRRVAVQARRAAVPGRCPAPSRPAYEARSA
jgi:hypothetical protein